MATRRGPVDKCVEHLSHLHRVSSLSHAGSLIQTEDIRLEPDLYEACKGDIKNHCSTVQYGNAQVTFWLLFFDGKSSMKVPF